MFSPYKQFGVEFNMNSWISWQSNQLTNPYFELQKSTIDYECIIFKTICENALIIKLLVYNESSFNVFKIKLFTTSI
jgi:hypothetical protein